MKDSVFIHDAALYSFYINVKNCLSTANVDERKDVGEKLISNIHNIMISSRLYFMQEIADRSIQEYSISYTEYYLSQLIQYIEDKVSYQDLERQQIKYRNYRRLYFKINRRYIASSMGKASDDYMTMMRLKFSYSLSEEESPFPDVQSKILLMKKDILNLPS